MFYSLYNYVDVCMYLGCCENQQEIFGDQQTNRIDQGSLYGQQNNSFGIGDTHQSLSSILSMIYNLNNAHFFVT